MSLYNEDTSFPPFPLRRRRVSFPFARTHWCTAHCLRPVCQLASIFFVAKLCDFAEKDSEELCDQALTSALTSALPIAYG